MTLFDDIKALERFPFAGAARCYTSGKARQLFVNRANLDGNTVCPYSTLRALKEGRPVRWDR